ncbi:MAG TPA: hypothetical protein PLX35_01640 [Cyclobacteriaceae bacterium]|nr:hypothetical protein [Cyclobacteriaceae bacterium]
MRTEPLAALELMPDNSVNDPENPWLASKIVIRKSHPSVIGFDNNKANSTKPNDAIMALRAKLYNIFEVIIDSGLRRE